jgi:hypothetical protein
LQFDSSDVTASATISSNAAGAFVAYKPPSQLTLNSMHTIRLFFSDTGARTFTNQWTFRVADLPVLRAAWVTPPGSGLSNGFNIIVNKVDREAQQQLFPNTASRAESQIDPGIPNPSPPPLYYPNQAAGPNGDGSSAELNVINYNGDGTDRGAFTGDQPLPNIPPAPDLRHIAMAVTAYVELSAGLHRFGVRRDDGFKLLAGPDFTRADATLTLGAFEPNLVDSTTATTEFDFMVESSGVYAVRLVFFENRGGSDGPDIEWYSVDRATGATTLINDTNSTAVKAYMARTGAPINNFQLLNPSLSGGNFSFSYPTVTGHQYYVEYKNSLTDAVWQTQPAVAGNGTTQSFSVPISTAASRFYRVRAQ